MHDKKIKYLGIKGFTLAEVLVTLSVIGVVAALTIPAIVNNAGTAGNITGAKQAFSIMSETAARLTIDEGGTLAGNCFDTNHAKAMNCLKQYLNLAKDCGTGSGCWFNDGSGTPYKYLNGDPFVHDIDSNGWGKVMLANGMSLAVWDPTNDCTTDMGDGPADGAVCADIYVDVNGNDGPNVLGRDLFKMEITKSGELLPGGSFYFDNDTPIMGSDWSKSCSTTTAFSGDGCLARILRENEIDY